MKLDRLETHDRYHHFQGQAANVTECCQNLIDQRPFGKRPFYVFAHKRTLGMDERFQLWMSGKYARFDDVPSATIIWQPRLTKPKAQTNSMLFKGYPGTDIIKVIWMLPERELWDQYTKGQMIENKTVCDSIYAFEHDRASLEAKEEDDLSDEAVDAIYKELSKEAQKGKKVNKILISDTF